MVELEEEAVCQRLRLGCRITDVAGVEAVLLRYGPLACTQANVGNMRRIGGKTNSRPCATVPRV